MLIHNFLENSAARYPDKPAVWYESQWITYGEVEKRANQVASYLIEHGIKKGDRVSLLFENSIDYVISYYGILKAGGVTVALNTAVTTDSLLYFLENSESSALLIQNKFLPFLYPIEVKLNSLKHLITASPPYTSDRKPPKLSLTSLFSIYKSETVHSVNRVYIKKSDLASIVYTSGSTGKPKGVMLTHVNIVSNTESIIEYLKLSADDRIMVVLPFYYIYGKSLLNTHVASGGSVVIDNRFTYPNVVIDTMIETAVTGFAGVPSTFTLLLHKSKIYDVKFTSLRYVTQAGGAMSPGMQKEVARVFYPADLYIMYGATEASARLSYLDPEDLHRKWGSIGRAIPDVELAVVDKQGRRLPPGKTGEIVARGANIMQGYWKDPEETAKVLKNGYYFTGDLGKKDEEGFFYVVGRKREFIKVRGNRVSAKEIEEAFMDLPFVAEAAVIGIEDDILGEAIKAFVVPVEGSSSSDNLIRKYLSATLPGYKIPKYIVFRNTLPKNASGKILKQKLKGNE